MQYHTLPTLHYLVGASYHDDTTQSLSQQRQLQKQIHDSLDTAIPTNKEMMIMMMKKEKEKKQKHPKLLKRVTDWWKQRRSFYVVHDISMDDISSDHRDDDEEDDDQEKSTIRESSFDDDEVELYNSTSFDHMNDDKEKIRRMTNVTSSMITSSQCQQNSNTSERSNNDSDATATWTPIRSESTYSLWKRRVPSPCRTRSQTLESLMSIDSLLDSCCDLEDENHQDDDNSSSSQLTLIVNNKTSHTNSHHLSADHYYSFDAHVNFLRHHTEPQQQVPDDVAWSQLRMETTNAIYPYPIPSLLRHEHHIV
jgi:hypothetical protein